MDPSPAFAEERPALAEANDDPAEERWRLLLRSLQAMYNRGVDDYTTVIAACEEANKLLSMMTSDEEKVQAMNASESWAMWT